MASKTASTSKKKKGPRQPASLISKLNLKLLQDRGRHCFNDWFSAEEIDFDASPPVRYSRLFFYHLFPLLIFRNSFPFGCI